MMHRSFLVLSKSLKELSTKYEYIYTVVLDLTVEHDGRV